MQYATHVLRQAARRLGRDEGGSMTVFGLFLFLMMLMVGGMAVDLMRYETNRTRLQATLDSAILAAADLEQSVDIDGDGSVDREMVVRDHFRAAGLLDHIGSVEVTGGINSSTVSVTAAVEIDTFFMDLVGVETLSAPAAGTANENVSDIEIVLVLDVSGSMNQNNRLVRLRAAAREFVQTILEADTDDSISIAIVPFNAQVNLGGTLMDAVENRYNITHVHDQANSNCIDMEMPSAAFSQAGLPTSLAMPQAGYFDALSTTTRNTSYLAPQGVDANRLTCRIEPQNIVRLPSQSIADLQGQVDGLTGNGNTSITLGMKWGLALLDPGSRPLFTTLIGQDAIPATLTARPYDYGRENTMKVVVLMTDGEHVASVLLDDAYRSGSSPIYRWSDDGRYSIRHSRANTDDLYWVPHLGQWHCRPWMGTVPVDDDSDAGCDDDQVDADGFVVLPSPLQWTEVWRDLRMSWVAWQLYARALGATTSGRNTVYTNTMNTFTNATEVPKMNSTLQQSCDQARQNDVVVFGIAFEAPVNGQTQIHGCASSPSHYYDAQGLEISTAFRAIAAQINTLRLTQ